ncbi:hypothetical protein [uncultured Psychroserpens sp.]|uniref:hypothetical protein n=1 Tax=uncultured Psychroserpens sp. TaxID=255436 RepID=UPI0026288E1C|nr:hypothetical protein [uncultured Psychroserpens sp.]
MKTISRIFSVVFILCLVSCSAEDGDDGMDGNANVISSEWISTNFSTTSVSFTSFAIQDENINAENVANAAIIAHGRLFSNDEVVTIPYARNSRFYYFSLSPDTNEIIFRAENLIGNQSIFNDLTEVRYTIIPSN